MLSREGLQFVGTAGEPVPGRGKSIEDRAGGLPGFCSGCLEKVGENLGFSLVWTPGKLSKGIGERSAQSFVAETAVSGDSKCASPEV